MAREAEGKKRLTEGVVAAALCPPEKKDVLLFDADLPGFGLRVTKAGSKVFFLQYGVGGGVKRRAVIGPYGELTPAQARKRAEALRGAVREHRDPVAERRTRQAADRAAEAQAKAEAARATYTVEALIDQWRDHHLAERSASYQARVPREMKAALKEWLAAPAASFGQADAIHVLDEAKTERGPVAANRLQAVARACWGWAVKRGSLASNPWTATPRPARERARERVLSDADIAVVWEVAAGMTRPWSDIIRLMLLTGQRRQEVAGMAWSELDLDNAAWHIPGARVKNGRGHTVPLAPQAVELLQAAKHIGPLVFQNAKKTAPSGFGKIAAKLLKATQDAAETKKREKDASGTEPWVLHDIRRTVATGLQRLGVRLEVTEAVLNHVSGSRSGIVGVYQRHGWEKEKRAALEAWAAHVLHLAESKDVAKNVADLAAERTRRKRAQA